MYLKLPQVLNLFTSEGACVWRWNIWHAELQRKTLRKYVNLAFLLEEEIWTQQETQETQGIYMQEGETMWGSSEAITN